LGEALFGKNMLRGFKNVLAGPIRIARFVVFGSHRYFLLLTKFVNVCLLKHKRREI